MSRLNLHCPTFVALLVASAFVPTGAEAELSQLPSRVGEKIAVDHPARLEFDGEIARPPRELAPPAKGAEDLSSPEGTVAAFLAALGRAEPAEVLSFWAPAEREALAAQMDEAWRSKSRQLFAGLPARYLGQAAYGPYLLVFVELAFTGQPLSRAYPLAHQGGRFYLTNELSGDLFLGTVALGWAQELARQAGSPAAKGTP